jgi:hypothetical protein
MAAEPIDLPTATRSSRPSRRFGRDLGKRRAHSSECFALLIRAARLAGRGSPAHLRRAIQRPQFRHVTSASASVVAGTRLATWQAATPCRPR